MPAIVADRVIVDSDNRCGAVNAGSVRLWLIRLEMGNPAEVPGASGSGA